MWVRYLLIMSYEKGSVALPFLWFMFKMLIVVVGTVVSGS